MASIQWLAVAFSHHEIDAGEDRDHIAHHVAVGHDGQRLQVHK